MFYAKYTSKEEARKFFGKFDSIKFDKEFNDFKFVFDYSSFTYKADGTKTNWIISSQGSRIERRREESANGNYISNTVYPTEILRSVLETEGINYTDGHDLREDILKIDSTESFKELYRGFNRIVQLRNSTIAGESNEEDYIISPVKNSLGYYFDSRKTDGLLPEDADANGAYNIARKGLWILNEIYNAEDVKKVKIAMSNKQWLDYAQKNIPRIK